MYLAIDIGGSKTLVATLNDEGVIVEQLRFETPQNYEDFKKLLAEHVVKLADKNFVACGVGAPGRVNRKTGVCSAMGNLPWEDVPLQADVAKMAGCPVIVDNDANLAGLSEAMLLKDQYDRVLFITVSTGIGTGIIVDQAIDPAFADSEGGQMLLEHNDRLQKWENFASGKAIVKRYGLRAEQITSPTTWQHIAHNIAIGLIDLIAVIQPQAVVIGGSVGKYLDRLQKPLLAALKQYETPLVPIPAILQAERPNDAVLYGCYDLAKSTYGSTRS